MTTELSVDAVHAALLEVAVPTDAEPMAAYMKHRFEFLGVKAPARRSATKAIVVASRHVEPAELLTFAHALRAEPEREFHSVATDLLQANARRLGPEHLGEVRRFVEIEPWWDLIDPVAIDVVGPMVHAHHELVSVMDDWIGDENFWIARVAILHQLKFKHDTDTERLFSYARRQAGHTEFFVRKAIGWALRQHARTDADAVREFIGIHGDEFAPLTVREATKHLSPR